MRRVKPRELMQTGLLYIVSLVHIMLSMTRAGKIGHESSQAKERTTIRETIVKIFNLLDGIGSISFEISADRRKRWIVSSVVLSYSSNMPGMKHM